MTPQNANQPVVPTSALRAYLLAKLERPGRSRLYATGFQKYGPTLESLANHAYPLIFETDIEGADYGIAGTCFLGKYRGQLFVLTAGHCLAAQNGNDVRIALNPKTKSFLPLKQLHRAQSPSPPQDYADIAVFEAAPELLLAEEQRFLTALELNKLRAPEMRIKADAKLVIPGFPKCLNEVDYDRFVLHTQRYLPSGKYLGSAGRPGIHRMEFDELEQISWPDGMSGSPVLFVEEHEEAHYFGLLGMLIRAHRSERLAEFIGTDVIFHMLDKIMDGMPGPDKKDEGKI